MISLADHSADAIFADEDVSVVARFGINRILPTGFHREEDDLWLCRSGIR